MKRLIMTVSMVILMVAFSSSVVDAGQQWICVGEIERPSGPEIVVSSDEEGVTFEVNLPGFERQEMEIEGEEYQKLNVPGGGHTAEVGKPEVATIGTFVAIPYGYDVRIEIIDDRFAILEGYHIYPAQEPSLDFERAKEPEFTKDDETYASNTFYPVPIAAVGEPGELRGYRVVFVAFYPIQFNPVSRQLQVHSHFVARLTYLGVIDKDLTTERIEYRSKAFEPIYRNFISNYETFEETIGVKELELGEVTVGRGADYLIITHDSFYDNIIPLAEWREAKRLKTRIVKTSEIGNDVSADDIANYIQFAYENWKPAPSYVLLVGDVDYVPTCYRTPHPDPVYERNLEVGTDLYYCTVAGDDYFPDIFIGRLPCDTGDEADIMIDKILAYERDPNTSSHWFNEVLLAGYEQPGRYFIATQEAVKGFLEGEGYTCNLVYTGGSHTGTTQDVIDCTNSGCLIVSHRDHGDSTNGPYGGSDGWGHPSFVTNDVLSLSNGTKLPVVFSINCRTGWFDGETDRDTEAREVDCLGEALIKAPDKGAVGFIGSTRISYSGYNDELAKGLIDAIWPDFEPSYPEQATSSTYNLGPILNFAKLFMYDKYVLTGGTGYPFNPIPELTKVEFEEFHLLGDPAMEIWTDEPQTFIVAHRPTILTGAQQLTVTVKSDGNPVEDALICLKKEEEVYELGYTDAKGERELHIAPSTGGELNVTVTKHNYRPYLGTVEVVD